MTTPKFLTIVYAIESERQQTELLAGKWYSVMHGDAVNENTKLRDFIAECQKEAMAAGFAYDNCAKDIAYLNSLLPAEKYDSKDWRDGCLSERIEWLVAGYEGGKAEIERLTADVLSLQAQLDAIGAGGVEPLRKRQCLCRIKEPTAKESQLCTRCTPVCIGGSGCFAGMPEAKSVRMVAVGGTV